MPTPVSNRKRERKALALANRLFLSYFGLWLSKKLFGKRFYQKRVSRIHQRNAQRVHKGILELRGLFIKVGQLLSSLSHILPEQYMSVLESMQDHAPESSMESIRRRLESEQGRPLSELFSQFEEKALASASIGQVHSATTLAGHKVAVKVQHEGIEALAEADLAIVKRLVKRVSFFLKIKGIEHVYGQISQMIREELDYQKEAGYMMQIRENLSEMDDVIIPEVIQSLSTERILVTSFQEGVKITNLEQLDAWKIGRNELGERFILTYLKMILEHGLYHADPHPGNLMVNENGQLIILDFGAVAVMNEEMRKEIPVLVQAILRKDKEQILVSLQKVGFVGDDEASEELATKLINALTNFLQKEVKISNLNFKDINLDDIKGSSINNLRKEISLRELTKTVRVPKDWILLDRTLQLLFGTCSTVAPDLNPVDVIRPYVKKLVLKDGGWKTLIIDAVKQQLTSLLSLPNELNKFMKKANDGQLTVKVISKSDKSYALGQQIILTLLGITSLTFYLTEIRPEFDTIFLTASGIFGLLLIRSIWKNRRI